MEYDLALKQGVRKVFEVSSRKNNEQVAALEEKIRALQAKGKPFFIHAE